MFLISSLINGSKTRLNGRGTCGHLDLTRGRVGAVRPEERLRPEVSVAFATDPVKSEARLKQQLASGQTAAEIELGPRYRRGADTVPSRDPIHCSVVGCLDCRGLTN
jgi:hypothetical protein